jgi:ComF family protein
MARTVAACSYVEPASSLISRFKYQAALQHGAVLGALLLERLRHEYRDVVLPRLLVPVPLHASRLRERGFNQALLLAQQLGAALNIPVAPTLLERVRQTPAQQGLSARERKQNLRGAFRMRADAVHDYTSIALIDDVVTTMSTVHEVARVLRRAGCGELEIHVWCLARA